MESIHNTYQTVCQRKPRNSITSRPPISRHFARWYAYLSGFLERCFRDYPRLTSWLNPGRNPDEKINQSGSMSGSVRNDKWHSVTGNDPSPEQLKVLAHWYGSRVHRMRPTQKKLLVYPLRNQLAFLSLGPNGTYYARGFETTEHPWDGTWKRGGGLGCPPISYELPQSLISDTRMVERLTRKRTQVWLGRHGSWVVHWKKGIDPNLTDVDWDVKWHLNDFGLYPGLEKFLRTYKTVFMESQCRKVTVHLMVSLYHLTRSIPASGNALGRQRALAIRQGNNC